MHGQKLFSKKKCMDEKRSIKREGINPSLFCIPKKEKGYLTY